MRHRKIPNHELKRLTVQQHQKAEKLPLTIVLDNIRSLNNIGSVFRTADAFLISKIYLCGITAQPPHRDIHKTALGATESVNWEYRESCADLVIELKDKGLKVLAVEQAENAQWLQDVTLENNNSYAVIFGNEVKGVSQQVVSLCDGVIEIPQLGTKHSLNIAVSAGIVMWDLFLKLNRERNLFLR